MQKGHNIGQVKGYNYEKKLMFNFISRVFSKRGPPTLKHVKMFVYSLT